ncbi:MULTISPECIES: ABC transporter ATP-binding protein [Agrobacterium]|jgi:branched-chain amino acid transport system ATP-binding protein|uniref:ABC transporter ATP-binding protein n=3 Tax=Agrobacterium TaxID=357 RepID=A0A4D7YSM8_AGRTU|nr:ABC transporter ATP-binding protein [Agrobacterium tumefaciens]KJF70860.1 metal-dependent hydrolase [Agrobacterium arsenijevicii]QCL98148.1 ABC transporter ATP-binding protein [Agrobacterium tumefaciens]
MTTILSATNICAGYHSMKAVSNVSMAIPAAGVVTLIGANGAGKTTFLSALMGLLPCTGTVLFQGEDVTRASVPERVGMGMSLVSEKRDLFSSMSVEDNLLLGCYRRNRASSVSSLDEVYGRFPKLLERRHQEAGTLSGGERQMLAMGRALMASPRLLMLDEPSLGLAPLIVHDIFRIIHELKLSGISILLVEQNARAALNVADHGCVLELGEVILQGAATELLSDPRLMAIYLGSAV